MDIEEIEGLRIRLAATIAEAVKKFEADTGVTVSYVTVEHQHFGTYDGRRESILTGVDVEVELPRTVRHPA